MGRAYDYLVQNGEPTHVLIPVDEYDEWIKRDMALEAIAQMENEKPEDFVDADDFALELAAETIADARKRAGLTQKQLGEKLGIPQSQVSRIERNPDRTTVRTMKRLAKALKVDVGVFLRFATR